MGAPYRGRRSAVALQQRCATRRLKVGVRPNEPHACIVHMQVVPARIGSRKILDDCSGCVAPGCAPAVGNLEHFYRQLNIAQQCSTLASASADTDV